MSCLSMVEANLPPGFRFHPRDDELICEYLVAKVAGDRSNGSFWGSPMVIDVDLNKCEPWDLPEMACVGGKEWYFFSLRDRKYATGQRTNRATLTGYWKATGKDRPIARKGVHVGMRKTLVFYQGRAPKGKKTDWVMHEFRMEGSSDRPKSFKEDWVLCRVFYKHMGISTKPSMETSYDDTGSSSLPPLMDTYITFDQTPQNFEGFEQVPCFSSFPPSHTSQPHNPLLAPHLHPMERSLPLTNGLAQLGDLTDSGSCVNPLSTDRKVIKEVLIQLTKLEGNPKGEVLPTLADGSLGGYFSETGLPSAWNPF